MNAPDPPHWPLNSRFGVFRTLWMHLGPFGCRTKLGANWPKWCKSSCHEVVSEFFAMNAPNPAHWTQNSGFIAFHTIFLHLGLFGCVTKHSAKRAKLVQKFVPRSRVGIFHNERTDRAGVPDLSVSRDKFDLAEDDPHDPTTTSEPEAPMQSLNQLPVVTDLVDARSA